MALIPALQEAEAGRPLRPAWSVEIDLGQPGLLYKESKHKNHVENN